MEFKNKSFTIILIVLFIPVLILSSSKMRDRIVRHVNLYLGHVKYAENIKITIPEGSTNMQIADIIVSKIPQFKKAEFLNLAKDHEGYLFPDTYFFTKNVSPSFVFDSMRKNFDKKTSVYFNDKTEIGKIKQYIIMASLLEKEATHDDMGIVSGILYKRLNSGMPLQADAAPVTYQSKGLPDAPISNPGIFAISSAINPIDSPYLYYLHDKHGIIHLARNFTEHKENIKKYLR